MKLARVNSIPAVQATEPAAKLRRYDQPETHEQLRSAGDDVKLSSLAKALKWGQDLLQAELGKSLRERFEALGVDLDEASGQDYSPDAVSDRIADLLAAGAEQFRDRHSELGDEQAKVRYQRLFQSGVESGYAEAMQLLKDMALPDEVYTTARETKGLIDSKLDAFFASAAVR